MATFLEISVLVVELIALSITFPGYMFILVVNILDWMKNKRLDISDQLISGVSLVILMHRFFLVSCHYLVITKGYQAIAHDALFINLLFLSANFCTLLFSTWLAIHFCLKIVNLNHKLYIYIQRRFPKMFPWILLPSVLASVLLSAPAAPRLIQTPLMNATYVLQNPDGSDLFLYFTPYVVFSALCFLLFFSSALNIILSLQRHIKQIRNNAVASRGQIVEAHVAAVKTVIYLLAFNLFYFALLTFMIVANVYLWTYALPFLYALCHILAFPILIRGSSKLQKKMRTLWLLIT